MAGLTDQEKAEMLRVSRLAPLSTLPPPILPLADYLRLIAELSRLPHPPKPVRFNGSHWKL